jgi:ribosomal protein S18 acetylase RimI-like enzyme
VTELWQPEFAASSDLQDLAEILHAAVHAGGAISFIVPFSMDEALAFWREKVAPGVRAGTRLVLVARLDGRVRGTVQVDLATPPNQAHRADIAKLVVHPDARRQGLARALMVAAEEQVRSAGRTLITLDTRTGDAAERLYLSLGYHLAGVIPDYSRNPLTEGLEAASFFYKVVR